MHSIDESLKRLKTDYVDLYQIHRFDYQTPIEETLSALHDVVKAGKALYIGASAMYAWQFMKMLGTSDRLGLTRFVSMQNCYNLLYREEEREMLPLCREEGIGVIPFSPLARGFIAGNRNREKSGDTLRAQSDDLSRSYFFTEQDFALVDRITEVAERLGTSNARLAMAWVLQQPGITSPIIGATKPHHISDAVAALELKLDESDLQSLTDPYKPRPIMAHS